MSASVNETLDEPHDIQLGVVFSMNLEQFAFVFPVVKRHMVPIDGHRHEQLT